ncbi:MAG: LD-carboxypeptidase [Acidobacteriota bacterium]|nr:LD-carboxypeptidase [Acidobacteriota bacterium]
MDEKIVVKPARLRIGDLVAIVAPASNLKREYLARGVEELERLGFRVKHRENILDKARYTAGSDERRAEELMQTFIDTEVKAVWAARGGYGVMRILKLLDEELLSANPKIFIGYSDLTALHLYLYRRFGWVSFHGPMAAKDLAGGEEHYDRGTLLRSLIMASPLGEIVSDKTEMLHHGQNGKVQGRLLGGCLSLVAAMMGTPDELDTRGSILFLEDTGTRPYAIDRMLQQLKLAGKFDDVRGIVFGEMADCMQHAEQGYTIQEVLAECTADLHIPVMFGLPSGHSSRGNLTLPLGIEATLDSQRGVLSINEAAVC